MCTTWLCCSSNSRTLFVSCYSLAVSPVKNRTRQRQIESMIKKCGRFKLEHPKTESCLTCFPRVMIKLLLGEILWLQKNSTEDLCRTVTFFEIKTAILKSNYTNKRQNRIFFSHYRSKQATNTLKWITYEIQWITYNKPKAHRWAISACQTHSKQQKSRDTEIGVDTVGFSSNIRRFYLGGGGGLGLAEPF